MPEIVIQFFNKVFDAIRDVMVATWDFIVESGVGWGIIAFFVTYTILYAITTGV